jgi:hypothetical protein
MRRGKQATAAVTTVLLVTFTAGGASAVTFVASGAFEVADVEVNNLIPAGFPSVWEARECAYQGSCPALEDVAFRDVDISDAMRDYEDSAYFTVVNGMVSMTTLWYVCSYDANGDPLDCWRDRETSWGLTGDLSEDARELRLMPIQSAGNEFHLDVYVH